MSPGGPSSVPSHRPPRTAAEWVARYPDDSPPASSAGAAVVAVLRDGPDDVEVLLIERANHPEDPAPGQVALPGGRVDRADGTLRATALRELEEEVGLGPNDLRGPPRFVRIASAPRFRMEVGVFTAELSRSAPAPQPGDLREVAHVFWFPRPALDRSETYRTPTHRGVLEVPAHPFDGHILWGFTRRIVRDFFEYPPDADPTSPRPS
ncbi:MAG TPA: CoA pyrophosphatase [Thermoplasmata archaeon]|nr:CoA pyrophosphatase [Thermoplasmata archaeon]